ncbi:hypothetical protein [Neisseria basseii]|uniref:hypothetical protein n=1 Tax=Neisseria basseii TaxID=2830650 RepID=UPI00265807CD|nr:hypothetical protein [Neisseria basseii]
MPSEVPAVNLPVFLINQCQWLKFPFLARFAVCLCRNIPKRFSHLSYQKLVHFRAFRLSVPLRSHRQDGKKTETRKTCYRFVTTYYRNRYRFFYYFISYTYFYNIFQ